MAPTNEVTIGLVDDSYDEAEAFIERIARCPNVRLVAEPVHDAHSGLRLVQEHRPDIVIVDLQLLDKEGGDADVKYGRALTVRIREHWPDIAILNASILTQPIHQLWSKSAGANGFFHKTRHRGRLCEALAMLSTGRRWFLDDPALSDLIERRRSIESKLSDSHHRVFALCVRHFVEKGYRDGVARWVAFELERPNDDQNLKRLTKKAEKLIQETREELRLPTYTHLIDEIIRPLGYDLLPPTRRA